MIRLSGAILLLCSLWLSSPAGGEPVPLEASELLWVHGGELRQAVLANVEAGPETTVRVTAEAWCETFKADQLPRFMNRLVIPVLPVQESRLVRVELVGTQAEGEIELQPVRRWEIYIVPHTHLDIGFTNLQEEVWATLARNLKDVIDLCQKTADWPEGSQFRWTIEGTALFENFAGRYPEADVGALVELIRNGRVELTAYYANLLTELCGPEGLLRAAYSSRRLSEQYNIRIDTAMMNDVPGFAWSLPQIWSQIGVRYANLRANGIRGKFVWWRPGAVPRPFRWRSADGSEVVAWYTDSYREANFLRRDFPEEPGGAEQPALQTMLYQQITGHLRRAASTGYEHDVIQLRMGGDNLTAVESVCRWVRYWNERWAYPKLRIATSREFFHALTNDSRTIPVVTGDIPDWWADGAATAAKQTGDARIAHDRAVSMETLLALPGGPATTGHTQSFAEVHRQILLYDEHTFGASGGWYDRDPTMVERQWAVKRGYVDKALATLDRIRGDWNMAVSRWARPAADSVIIWNPLSWPRTDLVAVPASELPENSSLRDGQDRLVPLQCDSSGNCCFIAHDVPPMGYKVYTIVPGVRTSSAKDKPVYAIDFDSNAGVVRQVIHRPSGRAMVDTSPRFAFNQYVYEKGGQREKTMPAQLQNPRDPAGKNISTAEPSQMVEHVRGPVFDRIVTRTSGPKASIIEQSYTTYVGLDRLDIANRVNKESTLDVEAVYFAFPLAFSKPACRIEIPFTTMRPGTDQLRYSATDFYSIYHYVELHDATGGVLWSSVEAPVVVFGDFWPECWRDKFTLDNGLLLSYVMSNYWFTNYPRQQGGELAFRYALRSYGGQPDDVRSYRFGCETSMPLVANVVRGADGEMDLQRSWFEVSPEHAALTVVKSAENGHGWILRLTELGVGDCACRLRLPPGVWSASMVDVTERDLRPLFVHRDRDLSTIEVALRRGQMAAVRVTKASQ